MRSLYQLSQSEKNSVNEISKNSLEMWQSWLQLLPKTLTPTDRRTIADYVTLLNLIIKAQDGNQRTDRSIWAKYHKLLPEVTNILSCLAVTSLSVRNRVPFEEGFFDLVVIDEASQCDIASALPLLYRAKRAVIIGDEKQLNHISAVSESQDLHLLEKHRLDEKFISWSYAGTSLFRLAASLSNSNDIVCAFSVLHHIANVTDVVNEIYRVTNKYASFYEAFHDYNRGMLQRAYIYSECYFKGYLEDLKTLGFSEIEVTDNIPQKHYENNVFVVANK